MNVHKGLFSLPKGSCKKSFSTNGPAGLTPLPYLKLNGHIFSLVFLMARLLPTPPLNGLAISRGTFFAASLR